MLKTLSSFIQDARFIALTQSILGALLRAIALARLKRQCLKIIILFLKKSVGNFEITNKTCSILAWLQFSLKLALEYEFMCSKYYIYILEQYMKYFDNFVNSFEIRIYLSVAIVYQLNKFKE